MRKAPGDNLWPPRVHSQMPMPAYAQGVLNALCYRCFTKTRPKNLATVLFYSLLVSLGRVMAWREMCDSVYSGYDELGRT